MSARNNAPVTSRADAWLSAMPDTDGQGKPGIVRFVHGALRRAVWVGLRRRLPLLLLGYAERIKHGWLEHKAVSIHNVHTGEEEVRHRVYVTPLGLSVLARRVDALQEAIA